MDYKAPYAASAPIAAPRTSLTSAYPCRLRSRLISCTSCHTASAFSSTSLLEEELANLEVAEQTRLLRTQAGWSQRQLAEKTGTTASVISRLESAQCQGHSLAMLRRIAAALNKRARISFISLKKDTKAA